MRDISLFFFLCFVSFLSMSKNTFCQITLSRQLLDSIISNTIKLDVKYIEEPSFDRIEENVLMFAYNENKRNSILMSYTFFIRRKAMPANACIYLHNNVVYFLIIDGIQISKDLEQSIFRPNSKSHNKTLDSIYNKTRTLSGIYLERRKLMVYEISKLHFSYRKFRITSKTFIPYSTAPHELKPIFPIIEELRSNDLMSIEYISPRYTYTDFYFDEMKPIETRKIILKREKPQL